MEEFFAGRSLLLRPSPDLRQAVHFYWYVRGPAAPPLPSHTFLPNGQVVLAFNLGAPFWLREVGGGSSRQVSQSALVGHHPRGLALECTGELHCFCVYVNTELLHRLRLFGLPELAAHPLLTLPEALGRLGAELEEAVLPAREAGQGVARLEAFFRRFLPVQFPAHRAFGAARQLLYQAGGQLGMEALSQRLGISYKALQRLFASRLGLAPKQYARSLRFMQLYDQFQAGAYDDLLDLAVRHGYYDQSHLLRDFYHFTNSTPALLRQQQPMPLFESLQQLQQVEADALRQA